MVVLDWFSSIGFSTRTMSHRFETRQPGDHVILDDKLGTDEVIVLDGAIGSEVARLGGEMHEAAWCAVANKTHPDVVRRVHEGYIRAGASIVTANTFATCRHVLDGAGLGDEAVALTTKAVELARAAIDNVAPDRPVAVAGSMSNTLAWIPGTFSADPRFAPTPDQEASNYREMADALAAAGADFLLMEMMLDLERATRVTQAAVETGLPVWIGISCSLHADGRVTAWDIHAEEPADRLATPASRRAPLALESVIDALTALDPQVVGIMHSTIDATHAGLDILMQRWDGPLMAYPEAAAEHHVDPETFAANCRIWVDNGVQIVGGCCGTTIEHIRALVRTLPEN